MQMQTKFIEAQKSIVGSEKVPIAYALSTLLLTGVEHLTRCTKQRSFSRMLKGTQEGKFCIFTAQVNKSKVSHFFVMVTCRIVF
jgi:hypothetical protein